MNNTNRRLPLSFNIAAAKTELATGNADALIARSQGSHNLYVSRIWAHAMTMRHDTRPALVTEAADSISKLLW